MFDLYRNPRQSNLSRGALNPKHIALMGTIIAASFLIVSEVNSSYAVEYSNYTSEKYRIQFQYPRELERY